MNTRLYNPNLGSYSNNDQNPNRDQNINRDQNLFGNNNNNFVNNTNPFNNNNNIKEVPVFTDFLRSSEATLPSQKITAYEHSVVIDSRQRDYSKFPSPSYYKIDLGSVYKNISSIELKGSALPRSSYNVHSTNKYIDFNIGSTITNIIIQGSGIGYSQNTTLIIASPNGPDTQVQATATVSVNANGSITSVTITNPGSGYSQGYKPNIIINSPTGAGAVLIPIIGTAYTAVLREGQYTIGGNNIPPSTEPSGLLLEIQNAMNYAVNGIYNPTSSGPFQVRLVNQYPFLGAVAGTPEYYNTNATEFNRVQIINVTPTYWELLFATGINAYKSSATILGYSQINYSEPTLITAVNNGSGVLIPAGWALRADNDYDLVNDPCYIILQFWSGSESFDRLDSKNSSIDRAFATIIFDANLTNTIKDTSGTTIYTDANGIDYLVGPVSKGTFWCPTGPLKAIRGNDFDQKKLNFSSPLGKLSNLFIKFTKFGNNSNELYEFGGKDHVLIFSLISNDPKSGQTS